MINIIEDTQSRPLCPHCDREITNLSCQRIKSTFGVRYLYFCSQCRKTLGISQRKGFWMG